MNMITDESATLIGLPLDIELLKAFIKAGEETSL